jgi:flagellar basal body-associated protein FliL
MGGVPYGRGPPAIRPGMEKDEQISHAEELAALEKELAGGLPKTSEPPPEPSILPQAEQLLDRDAAAPVTPEAAPAEPAAAEEPVPAPAVETAPVAPQEGETPVTPAVEEAPASPPQGETPASDLAKAPKEPRRKKKAADDERGSVLKDIVAALSSEDRPTRRMASVCVLAIVGTVLILAFAGRRYWLRWEARRVYLAGAAEKEQAILADFFRKRAEIAHRKHAMLTIGEFTVELKDSENGTINLAEVELVVECDSKETRYFLEDNLARARNQVTNAFVPLERSEFLTADGKERLKRRLMDALNAIIPAGKVENLFFSKLILS